MSSVPAKARLGTEKSKEEIAFVPDKCPKCCAVFQREIIDYKKSLGNFIQGSTVRQKTEGYDIIICVHCTNATARVFTSRMKTDEEHF